MSEEALDLRKASSDSLSMETLDPDDSVTPETGLLVNGKSVFRPNVNRNVEKNSNKAPPYTIASSPPSNVRPMRSVPTFKTLEQAYVSQTQNFKNRHAFSLSFGRSFCRFPSISSDHSQTNLSSNYSHSVLLTQAEAVSSNNGNCPLTSRCGSLDAHISPIQSFQIHPTNPLNIASNTLLAGADETLSPTHIYLQSLCDVSSSVSFPSLTLQRKRWAKSRDSVSSSTRISSNSHEGNNKNDGSSNQNSNISTSSSTSKEDSTGSEREKKSTDEQKDESYWDRRKKNNEAAKRSRDTRRQKEEQIAMRTSFLEQENLKLRAQVAILKNETAKLQCMLYNRVPRPDIMHQRSRAVENHDHQCLRQGKE